MRKVALYFGLLLAWRAVATGLDSGSALQGLASLSGRCCCWPLAGLGLLALLAWMSARTTVYTLTNRRVVLRVGIVLTVTFNLPLSRIDGAALRQRADGTGDLCLNLASGNRIAYLHLWPHVRPWQLARTQPMLRALPNAQQVAALVAQALQDTLDAAAAAAADDAAATGAVHPATAERPASTGVRLTVPASRAQAGQPLRPAAA